MKKNIFKKFFVLFVSLVFLSNLNAKSIAIANETVEQVGEYESVRFIAGNNVTNKAYVDGLSFVAGNNVNAEGKVSYGFYAGNMITISETVEKDAFIAGNVITIEKEANIGRDLYVAGSNIKIKSDIRGDLRAGAETIYLENVTIEGDAYLEAENIVFDENTKINGTLRYPEDITIKGLVESNMGNIERTSAIKIEAEAKINFATRLMALLTSIIGGIILLIVLFFIAPFIRTKLDKEKLDANNIFANLGKGFLVLIVTPVVLVMSLFTVVLIPMALIFLAIYIISIYTSALVASYVIGKQILKDCFKSNNQYLSIILGVVLTRVICLIPVFGGLIAFLLMLYGLGIIFSYTASLRKLKAK